LLCVNEAKRTRQNVQASKLNLEFAIADSGSTKLIDSIAINLNSADASLGLLIFPVDEAMAGLSL
jgi:hypothetical protein